VKGGVGVGLAGQELRLALEKYGGLSRGGTTGARTLTGIGKVLRVE
jgi:hypothetical protein